jgi:hypothetical protein
MAKHQHKNKTPNYWVFIAIAALLILALVFVNQMLGQRSPSQTSSTTDSGSPISSENDVPRMAQADAKKAYDSGEAVIIDVRSSDSYVSAHIPGALSIPLADIEQLTAGLDKNALYIDYCT